MSHKPTRPCWRNRSASLRKPIFATAFMMFLRPFDRTADAGLPLLNSVVPALAARHRGAAGQASWNDRGVSAAFFIEDEWRYGVASRWNGSSKAIIPPPHGRRLVLAQLRKSGASLVSLRADISGLHDNAVANAKFTSTVSQASALPAAPGGLGDGQSTQNSIQADNQNLRRNSGGNSAEKTSLLH